MKADLHVHSFYSGYAQPLPRLRARDCYSAPEDVYRVAKARGMDLVCLTDHDSWMAGSTCSTRIPTRPTSSSARRSGAWLPDAPGLRVHLGAIGMTERVHRDVQSLRSNVFDIAEYLREERVFFASITCSCCSATRFRSAATCVDAGAGRPGARGSQRRDARRTQRVRRGRWPMRGAAADGPCRRSAAAMPTRCGRSARRSPKRRRSRARSSSPTVAGRTHVDGGRHGGRARRLLEIYGVDRTVTGDRSSASSAGSCTSSTRLAAALSAILLPFQFVPAVIALRLKAAEAARVERYRRGACGRVAAGIRESPVSDGRGR